MPDSGRTSLERGLASVIVGLIVAAVMIVGFEPALRRFYPMPEADASLSAEQYRQMLESVPRFTFMLLWGLYAMASLVGGAAATLVSGRLKSWPALMTGVVLMLAGTFTVFTVYQPTWFRIASFLTYPMAYVGYLALRRTE